MPKTTTQTNESAPNARHAATPLKSVLTVKAVAAELGVSNRHVLDLIEEGVIPAIDVGRFGSRKFYRIARASLDQFKSGRSTLSAGPA